MTIFTAAALLALATSAAADVAPAPDVPTTVAETPYGVVTKGRKNGVAVELVVSDSINVGANLYEPLEETYTTTCYVDYDYETGEAITEECEESCGGYSYYLNGYVMVGNQKEIMLEVSYSNYCDGDDDDYTSIYFSACATVAVPPGTWEQSRNSAKVKVSGTLEDCGYYTPDGETPADNPLVGKTLDAHFDIRCRVLSEDSSTCVYTSSDESNASRSLNIYQNTFCLKEDVAGLTFDGETKKWDSASFGTSKSRDLNISYKRKKLRERKSRGLSKKRTRVPRRGRGE